MKDAVAFFSSGLPLLSLVWGLGEMRFVHAFEDAESEDESDCECERECEDGDEDEDESGSLVEARLNFRFEIKFFAPAAQVENAITVIINSNGLNFMSIGSREI